VLLRDAGLEIKVETGTRIREERSLAGNANLMDNTQGEFGTRPGQTAPARRSLWLRP